MDNLTPEQRKKNMRNIRSKNTLPEVLLSKWLKKRKIYFSSHVAKIFGKPDFVFKRKKLAIFVDSDFWHGNRNLFIKPKSNVEYWESKIEGNKKRDREVNKVLRKLGWKVIRIWEHDIKNDIETKGCQIIDALKLSNNSIKGVS